MGPCDPGLPAGRDVSTGADVRIKVYGKHYCHKAHRTYRNAAGCIWRFGSQQIYGDGPYVIVEKFMRGRGSHITLYSDRDEANKAYLSAMAQHADWGQCCGSCVRDVSALLLLPSVLKGESSHIDKTNDYREITQP